ncbi:DUF6880 family protein [Ochrobactrum quorumnocens]|uniref:DUF6880 family protein n=1 Tax=Ochrobactrum quorumnocens TaxID=271865 RepID=UPI0038526209
MARKPALSVETLAELGTEKLARLVLDEALGNSAFRKLVSAALAGQKGPEAVAKIVDRRLGALEKARSFIEWEKVRPFRDDLTATVATISGELGEAAPLMAIDRLLRFIATHEQVFERVDDSSGHIQNVYYLSIAALGELTKKLNEDEASLLPGRIMLALGKSSHGYLVNVAQQVVEHLPEVTLRKWDADLAVMQREQEAKDAKSTDRYIFSNASQYRDVRQLVADGLGDLDGLIALEEKKHPNSQDTVGIAGRLLEAGRAKEALNWIRRPNNPGVRYMDAADLADGWLPRDPTASQRTSLEAKILEALDDKEAAQSLRWSAFKTSLDTAILKEYVAVLPDFEEFSVLDRAFSHAVSSKHIYNALSFLMEWPRLDLAAQLIIEHQDEWDGHQYYMLPPVADSLQHDYPLAAAILYRALLDDILARARSKAYPHAARYLKKLDGLAPKSDTEATAINGVISHSDYRADLQKLHGRKSGFWTIVKQG